MLLFEIHPNLLLMMSKKRYILGGGGGWFAKIGYPFLGGLSRIGYDRIWVGRWVKNGPKKSDILYGWPLIYITKKDPVLP